MIRLFIVSSTRTRCEPFPANAERTADSNTQEVLIMRMSIVIAALLGLAGCATPDQRAAQVQAEVNEMIAVYGPACERLGYKVDDDHWRDCVMRLAARDNRRYTRYPTTTTCFGHRGFFNCSTF